VELVREILTVLDEPGGLLRRVVLVALELDAKVVDRLAQSADGDIACQRARGLRVDGDGDEIAPR
jgi:hypothetical protein